MDYGSAVKLLRTARGFTQKELADRIAINEAMVSMIETNQRNILVSNIDDICRALGVSPVILTFLASTPGDIARGRLGDTSRQALDNEVGTVIRRLIQDRVGKEPIRG